ncbi:MAG: glutamine--tRNA ligase, partial [Gammaproteobacteria bacterium]
IENYPEDQFEELDAVNHPNDPSLGSRMLPFGRELYIERDDFMEDPPKKFFRLGPGREVRLRYAYFITCTDMIKNDQGEVIELRCTYDPATRGGDSPDGRKVKGTIHWVSAVHAVKAEVRLYDRLFNVANPESSKQVDWKASLNPESVKTISAALVEPALALANPEDRYQFERLGYFCADRHDYSGEKPIFNRIVTLRDSWARAQSG